MAVLVVHNGNAPDQVIPLNRAEIIIGRLPECDIRLEPPGISRKHARIRQKNGAFSLADLGSRNRTKLNEALLESNQDYTLKSGDRINICDVELVFLLEPPPEIDTAGVEVLDGPDDSTIHMLDASRSDLQASEVKPEVKLKAILEISRNLSTSLKVETLAPKILESLIELFPQAERAFLVLIKSDDPQKWSFRQTFHKMRPAKRSSLRSSLGSSTPADERLRISRSIISHVVDKKRVVLSTDAGNDMNLPTSASIADLKIRSVMCAPMLTSEGQILGILQLDTSSREQFKRDDLDVLDAVARQATIALQNAEMHESLVAQEGIKRDLGLAQTIQVRFLPRYVPEPPDYEFFAHYQAAMKVGGDYYDFIPLGTDRLAIAVGDVAGKGVAAALMMAKFSGDIRACMLTEQQPGRATTMANRLLCEAGIEDRFITLSLCVLDMPGRKLTYASAGHLNIMIRRADGTIQEVGEEVASCPLGIDATTEYSQGEAEIRPGDVVLMFTDGVPDAENVLEERYDWHGNHRLPRRVAESGGTPTEVAKALLQDIREFSAGHNQSDDMTLVCFGLKPS